MIPLLLYSHVLWQKNQLLHVHWTDTSFYIAYTVKIKKKNPDFVNLYSSFTFFMPVSFFLLCFLVSPHPLFAYYDFPFVILLIFPINRCFARIYKEMIRILLISCKS